MEEKEVLVRATDFCVILSGNIQRAAKYTS